MLIYLIWYAEKDVSYKTLMLMTFIDCKPYTREHHQALHNFH